MSSSSDPSCDSVRATVAKVLDTYVVCYPEQNCGDLTERDSVTFSLTGWEGKYQPEPGQVVELDETCLYSNGWRAKCARPIRASVQ